MFSCLEGIWKISAACLECIWKVPECAWKLSGDIWKVPGRSGRCLEGAWKVPRIRQCLEVLWNLSGKYLESMNLPVSSGDLGIFFVKLLTKLVNLTKLDLN